MVTHIVRKVIEDFCIEFINYPYLCYTEHGLHSRFYCLLYNALSTNQRYIHWEGKRVCVVQKEYPTADTLGKSRRQSWDIAVIQSPPSSLDGKSYSYDYLILDSVVEFGLNATEGHLVDDINRLCDKNSNVRNKYILHFYRLSKGISGRDVSPNSNGILKPQEVLELVQKKDAKDLEIYYGLFDDTGQHQSEIWRIKEDQSQILFHAGLPE